MFQGRIFTQTGYGGRAIRFADQSTRGGVATTAYSFAMSSFERREMARRITAALNLTRRLSTEEMERMKAITLVAGEKENTNENDQ